MKQSVYYQLVLNPNEVIDALARTVDFACLQHWPLKAQHKLAHHLLQRCRPVVSDDIKRQEALDLFVRLSLSHYWQVPLSLMAIKLLCRHQRLGALAQILTTPHNHHNQFRFIDSIDNVGQLSRCLLESHIARSSDALIPIVKQLTMNGYQWTLEDCQQLNTCPRVQALIFSTVPAVWPAHRSNHGHSVNHRATG